MDYLDSEGRHLAVGQTITAVVHNTSQIRTGVITGLRPWGARGVVIFDCTTPSCPFPVHSCVPHHVTVDTSAGRLATCRCGDVYDDEGRLLDEDGRPLGNRLAGPGEDPEEPPEDTLDDLREDMIRSAGYGPSR